MPAPTEQRAHDQCSDARKRIDAYMDRRRTNSKYGNLIHWTTRGGLDQKELTVSDIESVLADADRDRQFVEAVRDLVPAAQQTYYHQTMLADCVNEAHKRIYGTPCSKAKEKA